MGKHDIGTPINESLELHYKERIERLEAQLELSTEALKTATAELEKKTLRIQVLEAKAETFSKALAEMTVKAVMGGVK